MFIRMKRKNKKKNRGSHITTATLRLAWDHHTTKRRATFHRKSIMSIQGWLKLASAKIHRLIHAPLFQRKTRKQTKKGRSTWTQMKSRDGGFTESHLKSQIYPKLPNSICRFPTITSKPIPNHNSDAKFILKNISTIAGGWTNPSEKHYISQIGSFPQIGMNIKKDLKPPSRYPLNISVWARLMWQTVGQCRCIDNTFMLNHPPTQSRMPSTKKPPYSTLKPQRGTSLSWFGPRCWRKDPAIHQTFWEFWGYK